MTVSEEEREIAWVDTLIELFVEQEPDEEELTNYLNGDCDEITRVRLEGHFLKSPESRREMGILQEAVLKPFLREMEAEKAVSDFLETLRSDAVDYWAKGAVIRSLGKLNAVEADNDLIEILADEDAHPWLVENSAQVLAQRRVSAAVPALKKFLQRENIDSFIREHVIKTLGEMESGVEKTESFIVRIADQIGQEIIKFRDQFGELKLKIDFYLKPGEARSATGGTLVKTVFAEGRLRVIEKVDKKTKNLEVSVFSPLTELEGGLITISAADIFRSTGVFYKLGAEVTTDFVINAETREKAISGTILSITDIKTLEEIVLDDLIPQLQALLDQMENDDDNPKQKAAAGKVKDRLKSLRQR